MVKVKKKTEIIEPPIETATEEPMIPEEPIPEPEAKEILIEPQEVKGEILETAMPIEIEEPIFPNTFEITVDKHKHTCDIAALEQEIKLLAPRLDKDASLTIKRLS